MKTNLLTLVLLLGGCTILNAQSPRKIKRQERRLVRHTRQAEFHARKASLEFCTTVRKPDTVLIPVRSTDTLLSLIDNSTHDTVVYEHETETIYMKTVFNRVDSTIYMQAICKEDSIIEDKEEQVKKPMNTVAKGESEKRDIKTTMLYALILALLVWAICATVGTRFYKGFKR